MKTWLVVINGKYQIVYSENSPDVADRVIAKVGDAIFEFDLGYVHNDTVYLKIITGFKLNAEGNPVYFLKDHFNNVKEVPGNNVSPIGPLTNWFYQIRFNYLISKSKKEI